MVSSIGLREAQLLQQYLELVDGTIADLQFLLQNIQRPIALDGSHASLLAVEQLLAAVHRGDVSENLWPDLLDTIAQLVARYGAVVLVAQTGASWRENSRSREPFLDVVPGEPWNRFFPLAWQASLRDRCFFKDKSAPSFSGEVEQLIRAASARQELVAAISLLLERAPDGRLAEDEIVHALQAAGAAPDPRYYCAAARAFPKRVAAALRHSRKFSRPRGTACWKVEA